MTGLCLALYFISPRFIHDLELVYQKMQFEWRGPKTPGNEVVIATVDEKSLDRLGRWPWSRNVFAQIIDNLTAMGARVIAFDMVFSSPDESGGRSRFLELKQKLGDRKLLQPPVLSLLDDSIQSADRDAQFAKSIKQSRKVVLGYFFHFTSSPVDHLTQDALQESFEHVKRARFRGFIKSEENLDLSSIDVTQAYAVESNLAGLSNATRNAGFFSFDVESDGTLRKQPLLVRYHDAASGRDFFFPSLAVKSLEKFLKGTLLFRVGPTGVEKVLIDTKEPIVIPTNRRGEIQINYLGRQGAFPYVSLADVHDPSTASLKPETFQDKIVLIGATATALKDIRMTPFDPVYPGVEIHATLIDNMLRVHSLYEPEWLPLLEVAYLIVFGLILTLIFANTNPMLGVALWLAISFGHFSFVQWFLVNERVWLFGVIPGIQSLGLLSLISAQRFLVESNQKRFIRNVFNQYVSPEVIDRLITDPGNLKLGGEQRELTAFFTDLAGFTTFSEQMTAEAQVSLLNEYLGEMTDILLKHEGTLDKYDGDAIKAFFGAPVYFENHAEKACRVGIEMQQRLGELREKWKKEGLPELKMRIGINTGMMVVGNLGSQTRMSYGMNGDAVNLAARLEGANKFYGTYSMISESTYLQARTIIEVREMDCIQVVGRKNAVTIYELLGLKGCLSPERQKVITCYQNGLDCYKVGQWEESIQFFTRALELDPEDGPSKVLLNRCIEMKETVPEGEWDGVYTLSGK